MSADTNEPVEIRMTGELAPRSAWGVPKSCPIARTFEVLGTRTSYLIVREALYGATRFEEFVQRTGVSEPVAAARLRELTDEGLLVKEPYQEPGQRTRHAYRITAMGADLVPVLAAMMGWADRWLYPNGARVHLTHAGCGAEVAATLRCEAGHQVHAGELELAAQPHPPAAA